MQSFIKLLQDHHTKLDLTLSIFEDQYMARIGQIPPGYQIVANRLPAQVRRSLLTQGMTPPEGMDETYKKSFAKMLELTGLLSRSGLGIEAGTDSMAGFALHRELELEVKAGIPAAQVLQNATLNAAKIMNLDKDLGSITAGKLADLVLVDGDPTQNINDIRKTELVVKDGVIYKPAELYTELGVSP
jgi:imidazolonepropionase-like amidohydrolase